MQGLANVILREERILELHLRVALLKFFSDIAVGDRGASRDEGRQFSLQDFVLDVLLKGCHRQVVLGQQALVCLLSDELPSRKQGRAEPAILEFVAHVCGGGLQAHAFRFGHNRLAGNHLLNRLRNGAGHNHGQQLLSHRAVLRHLLFGEGASVIAHFLGGDVLARHLGEHTLAGLAEQVGTQASGNEGDDHATTDNEQQGA